MSEENQKDSLLKQQPRTGSASDKAIQKNTGNSEGEGSSDIIRFDSGGSMPPGKPVTESDNKITMSNTKPK